MFQNVYRKSVVLHSFFEMFIGCVYFSNSGIVSDPGDIRVFRLEFDLGIHLVKLII